MNPETPESPAFGDVSAAVEPVFERKVCNVCGSSWTAPPNECPGCDVEGGDPVIGLSVPPEIAHDLATAGLSSELLHRFADAARALKAAEEALIAARQVYAEAVKALSEEAVK